MRKLNKILNVITVILLTVFIIVVAVSGIWLWKILHKYHEGDSFYQSVEQHSVKPPVNEPEDKDGCPITVDFTALLQQNPDVVGWIYCDGTRINYPVVKGKDNEQYLYHLISGEYNSAGSIFMDSQNDPDLNDLNTVLHGHHMKNGTMFAALHFYTSQAFYDEHPVMWYLTPQHTYRLILIAGYVSHEDDPVYTLFQDRETLDSYLQYSMSRSNFAAIDIPADIDRIMALSTCTYERDNGRYVLIGVPVLDDNAE